MESPENNEIVDESEGAGMKNEDTENGNENNSSVEIKLPTFGFTEPSWRTDFCLVVEGTRLYVAKNILSLVSPVFETMFQSDFKEKSCDELELPGKKLSDVIAFLRCIYPNTCAEINRDNTIAILPLIEEYQVWQFKPKCEAVLLESVTKETTTDELLQMLKQACLYDLKTLRARCILLISSRPCDELDETYYKSFLSESVLNEILLYANKSMKNKLTELEKVEEENELLKKYISSEVLNKNVSNLRRDPEKKWDDKTVILIDVVPTKNNESGEKTADISIWGIAFKICMKKINNALYCEIRNMDQMDVNCDISAYCVLVNRQPTGCNHVVNLHMQFYSDHQIRQFHISDMSTVENFANRFDGKFGIIIQLYVTQPNLNKRKHSV